jgi:thymidylate synthase
MNQYLQLLRRVLHTGTPHTSRAGPTHRLWCDMLRLDMSNGEFPLITTRPVNYRPVLGELAAFLEGEHRTARFEELGCKYWGPNAKAWRAPGDSVGRVYGVQWRRWNEYLDQLEQLVNGMRDNPDSRRHVLTAWNPEELGDMCLPPCHVLSQYSVRANLVDCAVYMRSVDVCLGLPSDMILYGALLALIAQEVGRKPGELIFFLADCHIYDNHREQARAQTRRDPWLQPQYKLDPRAGIDHFHPKHFEIVGYKTGYAEIKYELNV